MSQHERAIMVLPRDPYDALRLDNDVLGVRLWGPASQPTLSLGKADIWDRRWFGDRQPLVTLRQMRELAMRGELSQVAPSPNRTIYDVYNRYDFPCPKPGAQVVLGAPFADSAAVERGPDGSLRLAVEGGGKILRAAAWVALARHLVVIEIEAEGLEAGDLWVRVYRHRDTIVPGSPMHPSLGEKGAAVDFERLAPPLCWRASGHFGILQRFHAEPTFPRGFSFIAAATVLGAEPTIECREGEPGLGTPLWAEREGALSHGVAKRYTPINEAAGAAATAGFPRPPTSLAVVATIATAQDGPDPAVVARGWLDDARALGIESLRAQQRETLERGRRDRVARARVGGEVRLAAPQPVQPRLRRPGGYYGDIALCSVDSTRFCFQDSAPWHADFHLNEIRAEPMLTLGRFEELLPYCEMIHTLLPQAQENARDVYDLPGAMYPLVHFPLRTRGIAHTNLTWEQDMGLDGLVSKPLWLYYRYTGDEDFLREIAWPVLRECARFMAAYVTEEADGRLHIVPTVSPEHWGLTARFERNRDCLSALTLTRYLLAAAARAAWRVGAQDAEANGWRYNAALIAPYPTHESGGEPIWVDVAGAPPIEYNIPVPLAAVFWGDDVGLDSPPETLALARRTLERINVWEPHLGYLDGSVRPRLGVWREGAAIGPENLLLSYQSLRIFPAVAAEAEVVMEEFAAQGGFRVSAVHRPGGVIEGVRIRSVLGEPCRVASPWPGRAVAVTDHRGGDVTSAAPARRHITWPTKPGEEYQLRPQRRG